jgi:hypothetical protein
VDDVLLRTPYQVMRLFTFELCVEQEAAVGLFYSTIFAFTWRV